MFQLIIRYIYLEASTVGGRFASGRICEQNQPSTKPNIRESQTIQQEKCPQRRSTIRITLAEQVHAIYIRGSSTWKGLRTFVSPLQRKQTCQRIQSMKGSSQTFAKVKIRTEDGPPDTRHRESVCWSS